MPAERVSMKKIRDVLRLTHTMGLSSRKVSEATGIGRTAISDYVRRAAIARLTWPLPEGLDDTELERRLFPPCYAGLSLTGEAPDWSYIHAGMKRRGVTLALLWQEYRTGRAQGCAYSTFCEQFRSWKACVSPTSCRRRAGRGGARPMWRARSYSSTGLAIRSPWSTLQPVSSIDPRVTRHLQRRIVYQSRFA